MKAYSLLKHLGVLVLAVVFWAVLGALMIQFGVLVEDREIGEVVFVAGGE